MKYTPGPWTNLASASRLTITDRKHYNPIAFILDNPADPEESLSNAHLIVAAPSYHEHAYNLAMLVLQSKAYQDPEIRDEVDNVLAIWKQAEGME